MFPQEIISKKRDGLELTSEEIKTFAQGVANGSFADCQIGALTMAIFLNGLSKQETTNLALSMRDSGTVLSWSEIDIPVVDKHSSGGVGDKVSLMLAPLLASCGAAVPMISGRGLGHTGGTLDKFDSIPGYQTQPSNEVFRKTVKEVGCAIIGQTAQLAPADKKIYAIRDVCATVASVPLITASILSKKLAAGLDYLVMDLKFGNGAFMQDIENGRILARSIIDVANNAGTKTRAVLSDMNQLLGYNAGNAVEVLEAVEYLKMQNIEPRQHEVTMKLAEELLVMANLATSPQNARKQLEKNLSSGKALEIFAKMVSSLGGPTDFVEKPQKYLPQANIIQPLFAKDAGFVSSMNCYNIGMSIIDLKGGRTHPEQKIDHSTGYSDFCQIGDFVDEETPICFIHAQSDDDYERAAAALLKNIKTSQTEPKLTPVVAEVME